MGAPIPFVRGSALPIATGFLDGVGAPVDRLPERARPSPRMMRANPEAPVPFAALARFIEEAAASDLGAAVQEVVTTLLPKGYPDIHLVAEAVRMTPRTLQRRLHSEGLTFAGLLAKARFAEARRMLGDPDRKVIDVALDLGYSDPAHFTRAFERWAGVAPSAFRRRLLEGAEAIAS